jgi:hypothetical protein
MCEDLLHRAEDVLLLRDNLRGGGGNLLRVCDKFLHYGEDYRRCADGVRVTHSTNHFN